MSDDFKRDNLNVYFKVTGTCVFVFHVLLRTGCLMLTNPIVNFIG